MVVFRSVQGASWTAEGFSLYTPDSDFGPEVARFGPGMLLGELALLNDDRRSATAKCLEDTELLVVKKEEFDNVLKEDMNRRKSEKIAFLRRHLPGIKELPQVRGRPHASYFFRQESTPRGHCFLRQGVVAEEAIYIVLRGFVETSRIDPLPRPDRNTRSLPMAKGASDVVRQLVVLLPGAVFGSMPVVGELEPFTITAGSQPTEVLYVRGEDVARLPRRLQETVREHVARVTLWRLDLLRCSRAADELRHQAFEVTTGGSRPCTAPNLMQGVPSIFSPASMAGALHATEFLVCTPSPAAKSKCRSTSMPAQPVSRLGPARSLAAAGIGVTQSNSHQNFFQRRGSKGTRPQRC